MSLFNFGRTSGEPQAVAGVQKFRAAPQRQDAVTPVQPVQQSAQPAEGGNVRTIVKLKPGANEVPGESEDGVSQVQRASRAQQIVYGGLNFFKDALATEDELVSIPFFAIINSEMKLGPWLNSQIAVAQVTEGSKDCAIFVDRGAVTPETVQEVLGSLELHGRKVLRGYFATSQLIMSLCQGQLTGDHAKSRRDIIRDPAKSGYFRMFREVVEWAYDRKADDIDWILSLNEPMSQIAFKIGGRYIRPERHRITTENMARMLGIAWQLSGGGSSAQFDTRIEQQAQITLELPAEAHRPKGARIRLRWSGMAVDKGAVVTQRLQRLGESALVKTLAEAGYLEEHLKIFRRVTRSEGGLVIFAGVVGSGKSTSLAALIKELVPPWLKIQSIEDPVELEIPLAHQKTVTRDLQSTGVDAGFLSAARAVYRSALDVLYLGEIRDTDTGGLARQVVQSGHTVFTTIHADSGLGIIPRLVSPQINVPREVLGAPNMVKLLVYQALLPVLCHHCSTSPDEALKDPDFGITGAAVAEHHEFWARVERLYGVERGRYRIRHPHGCEHCRKEDLPDLNGLNGRTVVCEMIEPNEEMQAMIHEGRTRDLYNYWRSLSDGVFDSTDLTGKTAMECAIYKATEGLIDMREIEERFESFETIEVREKSRVRAARAANGPQLAAVAEAGGR